MDIYLYYMRNNDKNISNGMMEWRDEKDKMEDDERMMENCKIRRKLCIHRYKYLMNSISRHFISIHTNFFLFLTLYNVNVRVQSLWSLGIEITTFKE